MASGLSAGALDRRALFAQTFPVRERSPRVDAALREDHFGSTNAW
jgi:hypothetical protein